MDVHPLQIVRAGMSLFIGDWAFDIETGPRLAIATCLYLILGALLGIPLHRMFNRTFAAAPGIWRFLVATAIGMLLALLSIPLLHGTPFWWTAFTILAYFWIVLLLENWGRPLQRQAIG
jgi:prepilin signal peptidase PulO-like enzyme (type II secretory pathway)